MFKLYLLFFILFLASAQTLQDKKDFWNTIHEVSHNWNEEKVVIVSSYKVSTIGSMRRLHFPPPAVQRQNSFQYCQQ